MSKILITTPNCPHCAEAKEKLKEKIKKKEIKICSVTSKKGSAICDKLGIISAPTLIECSTEGKCRILPDSELA